MMTDTESKLLAKYGPAKLRAMASEARMVMSGAMSAVDSNGKRLPLRCYVAADMAKKGLI